MGIELALLILTTIFSGLSALGLGWLILRLRSRGIGAGTAGSRFTVSVGDWDAATHVHEFAERNPNKYGDDKRHCNVPGCGEPKPD